MRALFRALSTKRPPKGLIHHSDRGSQYCAHDYQKLLCQFGMVASMSRKGDCWENEVSVKANTRSVLCRNYNAPIERFWGTLKNGLVHHRKFQTRQQAKLEISEYIEVFYNRQRRQKRLGCLPPAAFTQRYYATRLAA